MLTLLLCSQVHPLSLSVYLPCIRSQSEDVWFGSLPLGTACRKVVVIDNISSSAAQFSAQQGIAFCCWWLPCVGRHILGRVRVRAEVFPFSSAARLCRPVGPRPHFGFGPSTHFGGWSKYNSLPVAQFSYLFRLFEERYRVIFSGELVEKSYFRQLEKIIEN